MLSEFPVLDRVSLPVNLFQDRGEERSVCSLYLPGNKTNRSDVLVGKACFMLSFRFLVGIQAPVFPVAVLRLLTQEEAHPQGMLRAPLWIGLAELHSMQR